MAELKKLVPGESLIGILQHGVLVDFGKVSSEPGQFLLFYGNVVVDPSTEKKYHASKEKYMAILENFLESSEGKRYERPTPEEIEEAIAICITPPSLPPVAKPNPVALESDDIQNPETDEDAPAEETTPVSESEAVTEESSDEGEMETEPAEVLVQTADPEISASDETEDLIEEEDFETTEAEVPIPGTPEESTHAEIAAEKSKKTRKLKLFKKRKKSKVKKSKEPAQPDTGIELNLDDLVEDENAYVPPSAYSDFGTNDAQSNRITKLTKEIKRLRTAAMFLLVFALLPYLLYAVGVIGFGQRQATPTDEIHVISLAKDVKAGEVIPKDALTESIIMREQFNDLSGGTAIDSKGNTVKDYVQLWSNRNAIAGQYATGNLEAGDYLLASDYAVLKNGMNMIEIDVDGTKVKVPVSATKAGSSDVRVYAIITTRNAEGVTKSFALNLGELAFEGKSLKDVINSEGESILEGIDLE
ncbi:MAG: hypothetical protein IJ225_06550 [Solobacterium sp.]|nr:hypothetical protein [Solobacterium sp.]